MDTIHTILRAINKELVPQFEQKLRSYLAQQDREWLIEQIVRLTLDAHHLEEMDRKTMHEARAKSRRERMDRIRAMKLDVHGLERFLARYQDHTRERLVEEGHLRADAPEKGTAFLTEEHRTQKGTELLTLAKDNLFALLFGGQEDLDCTFHRTEQKLLTMTVPRFKAGALDFMKATTELSAQGNWQDPDMVSNDSHEDNVILQVEYGEIEGEKVGTGIVLALKLINNLEVNEKLLYARIEHVEQSTLIS